MKTFSRLFFSFVLPVVSAGLLIVILDLIGIISLTEVFVQDLFQQIRDPELCKDLLIVDIDKSIINSNSLGDKARETGLPKRDTLPTVIDNLLALGARVIVIDLLLKNPSSEPGLIETAKYPNVIHCTKFKRIYPKPPYDVSDKLLDRFQFRAEEWPKSMNLLHGREPDRPFTELARAASNLGHTNLWLDAIDNKVRSIPVLLDYVNPIPSISLVAISKYYEDYTANVYEDKIAFQNDTSDLVTIPFSEKGLSRFCFLNKVSLDNSSQKISYDQFLNITNVDTSLVRGKLVLIGATGLDKDKKETPISNKYPGLYIHTSFLNSILQGSVLRQNDWIAMPIFLITGIPFFILLRRQSASRQLRTGAVLLILIVSGMIFSGYMTFLRGWIWDVAFPVYGMMSVFAVALAERKIVNQKHERVFNREIRSYQIQVKELGDELQNQHRLLSFPDYLNSHLIYLIENDITKMGKQLENRTLDLKRISDQHRYLDLQTIQDQIETEIQELKRYKTKLEELTGQLKFLKKSKAKETGRSGDIESALDSNDPNEIRAAIDALSKSLSEMKNEHDNGSLDIGRYLKLQQYSDKQMTMLNERLEQIGAESPKK